MLYSVVLLTLPLLCCFFAASIESSEIEDDFDEEFVGNLSRIDALIGVNLGMCYFGSLNLLDYPNAPNASDFTQTEWVALMCYYNTEFHKDDPFKFTPTDINIGEKMKRLCCAKHSNSITLYPFYLEALCRIGKMKTVKFILEYLNGKEYSITHNSGAAFSLAYVFPSNFSQICILEEAIFCPCLNDEEFLSL